MTYTQKEQDAVQVEGVSVFSPHMILFQDSRLLTRTKGDGDDHQRVCLGVALLYPPWGIVHVFNTHMSLSLKQQVYNMNEIIEFMEGFGEGRETGELPVLEILVGDMNATPREAEWLAPLLERGWVDSWDVYAAATGTRYPGFTFNNLHQRLSKRIDFVLIRQREGKASVRNISLAGRATAADDFVASDHLAVAVDILLQR
jgi:endonuclease/exonuclease/phosphatase family metal-dependent hydrolase